MGKGPMASWGPRGGLSLPTSRGLAVTRDPQAWKNKPVSPGPPGVTETGSTPTGTPVSAGPRAGAALSTGPGAEDSGPSGFLHSSILLSLCPFFQNTPGSEQRGGHDSQPGGTWTWLREVQAH